MASPLAVVRASSYSGAEFSSGPPRTYADLDRDPVADLRKAKPAVASRDKTMVGVAALLLSTVLFPLSDMLSKTLAESYSGLQVTWMRYVVLLVAIGPVVVRRPGLVRTTRPFIQIIRGLSSATATTLALAGFVFLPVADATAIGFCAPLTEVDVFGRRESSGSRSPYPGLLSIRLEIDAAGTGDLH